MQLKKIKPSQPLDEYIENYVYLEGNNKGISLPKTNLSVVFNLGDAFKLFDDNSFTSYTNFKKHWIAGIQTKPNFVESYGTSRMFTIQFKTLGCFAFFKEPLYLFKNEFVTLDTIFGAEVDYIWERLISSQTLESSVLIIENYLTEKLIQRQSKSSAIERIHTILGQNELGQVKSLTAELNTSRKHLNHLFNQYIGVSPKTLLSIIRLNHTYKTISQMQLDKLSFLAYEMEYSDQAHFNNNFKQHTSLTPTEYIKLMKSFPSMHKAPHYIPCLIPK